MTQTALADLLAADPSGPGLVALMVDGVHSGDHPFVVALGIDIDGTKHPLALVERSRGRGSTPRWCARCWSTCPSVAWMSHGPILAVLDGAKALAAAVDEAQTLTVLRLDLPPHSRAPCPAT